MFIIPIWLDFYIFEGFFSFAWSIGGLNYVIFITIYSFYLCILDTTQLYSLKKIYILGCRGVGLTTWWLRMKWHLAFSLINYSWIVIHIFCGISFSIRCYFLVERNVTSRHCLGNKKCFDIENNIFLTIMNIKKYLHFPIHIFCL